MINYDLWLLPDDDEDQPRRNRDEDEIDSEAASDCGGDCEYWQRVMQKH